MYHLAALRYRRRLWRPFIADLNHWLVGDWNPRARELIIFGASAGWTLEERFLRRFRRVLAVEPDPLARLALRQRFPSVAIEGCARHDLLPWSSSRPEEFGEFLAGEPGAAILFSNLLGQLPLLRQAAGERDPRRVFFDTLSGREWASYHDLFSADCAPAIEAPLRFPPSRSLDAVGFTADAFDARGRVNVTDHDTFWLLKDREWLSIPWRLRPARTHIIACVHGR